MSKGGGTTQTTSTTGLPDFQLPYIKDTMQKAQDLYSSGGPQYYPGYTVEGFTAPQVKGQEYLTNAADAILPRLNNDAMNAFEYGTTTAKDPMSNPAVQGMMDASTRNVMDALTKSVLPNLRTGAMSSGGMGGTRQSLAESLAVDAATKNALDANSSILNNAYNTGQNTFNTTLGQLGNVMNAQTMPGQVYNAVGDTQQAQAQKVKDADITRWTYNQNLPYQTLTEYQNAVKGSYGGTGSSTVAAPETGTASQILGLGTSLAGALPGIIKAFQGLFG